MIPHGDLRSLFQFSGRRVPIAYSREATCCAGLRIRGRWQIRVKNYRESSAAGTRLYFPKLNFSSSY
jgi:hypothetical protein